MWRAVWCLACLVVCGCGSASIAPDSGGRSRARDDPHTGQVLFSDSALEPTARSGPTARSEPTARREPERGQGSLNSAGAWWPGRDAVSQAALTHHHEVLGRVLVHERARVLPGGTVTLEWPPPWDPWWRYYGDRHDPELMAKLEGWFGSPPPWSPDYRSRWAVYDDLLADWAASALRTDWMLPPRQLRWERRQIQWLEWRLLAASGGAREPMPARKPESTASGFTIDLSNMHTTRPVLYGDIALVRRDGAPSIARAVAFDAGTWRFEWLGTAAASFPVVVWILPRPIACPLMLR